MARKLTLLASVVSLLAVSQASQAELYIIPVIQAPMAGQAGATMGMMPVQPSGLAVTQAQGAVAGQPYNGPIYQVVQAPAPVAPLPGTVNSKTYAPPPAAPIQAYTQANPAAVPTYVQAPAPVAAPVAKPIMFGRDVPVKAAVENLASPRGAWSVVLEPGLESKKVSWSDAADWRAALDQISWSSGLVIKISDTSKRIAISRSESMAQQLIGNPNASVWTLKSGVSLRENLVEWGRIAKWDVHFVGTDINYPVDHAATLVGQFEGKGGVVDRLMMATQAREVPLKAVFYKGNRVVVIKEDGFKPTDATVPASVGEDKGDLDE
ncbi:hypothetical protein HNP46_000217 [Pseudomonas nitritireducens]|uniref:Toxin co-regulated pilus biosynthesis protein Q C-terminal domain-containing protein n=1 Tax=Pseudomonas nitroreducens TaxID=46680 RepID=A0A7W7KFE0_PSENT|nr:TcpQ domain-containing protein [Pseudomonas nitritireducens]MBB4861406.1 hypothetical protein [Pseudomonas nitritireducens]